MIKFNNLIKVADNDSIIVDKFSKALNISKITSKVMLNRGIEDINKAEDFINPVIQDFHDPFLLKDMDVAADRIIHAIHRNDNTWIYGDYDVDGVTSTSVLIIFLRSLFKNVEFYIPDRISEGYGLNTDAIDYIKDKEGQLIISVDCGIQSFEVAEYCRNLGIDLIITDHHACGEKLPDATAVINPNRTDNEYPFTKLAGVGVALKLIQAVASKLNLSIEYEKILPIVAIGTVADVVSLTGENRIIVKNGLKMIKHSDNQGIKALLEVTGLVNKEVTSGHIGFVIGPRINATGRIGMAKYAVQLFITNNYEEAQDLANMLNEENIKRQNIETEILFEAEEIINKEIDLEKVKVIVIASENWHNGVIGIVSSRITEKYHRPSILISIEGNEGRGSARSISTFNLYENLNKCKELFVKFGGHSQAAGLTIEKGNIEEFRKRINYIADEILDDIDFIPENIVDAVIDFDEISLESAYELKSLEPFGIDNPSPSFLFKGSSIKAIRPVGKDGKHLKLIMEKDGQSIECIGFNFGRYLNDLEIGQQIDLVASLDINDYLGQQSVQFLIKDIIISYERMLSKSDNYIESLLSKIDESDKGLDIDLDSLPIRTLNEVERINYTINSIKESRSILIIINNIFNLSSLLDAIQYEGRNFIKKIDIAYNTLVGHRSCDIIINPIIDNLNMVKYEKVIVYDKCFTYSYLMRIINSFKHNELQILTVKNDYLKNKSLIEDIVPKINDVRLIYKTLISRKEEYLRIEIDKYLDSLTYKTGVRINRFKLITILAILKNAELLEYIIKVDFLNIKMLRKPDKKIDINSVSIYDKLCQLPEEINKLENKFKLLY